MLGELSRTTKPFQIKLMQANYVLFKILFLIFDTIQNLWLFIYSIPTIIKGNSRHLGFCPDIRALLS